MIFRCLFEVSYTVVIARTECRSMVIVIPSGPVIDQVCLTSMQPKWSVLLSTSDMGTPLGLRYILYSCMHLHLGMRGAGGVMKGDTKSSDYSSHACEQGAGILCIS